MLPFLLLLLTLCTERVLLGQRNIREDHTGFSASQRETNGHTTLCAYPWHRLREQARALYKKRGQKQELFAFAT